MSATPTLFAVLAASEQLLMDVKQHALDFLLAPPAAVVAAQKLQAYGSPQLHEDEANIPDAIRVHTVPGTVPAAPLSTAAPELLSSLLHTVHASVPVMGPAVQPASQQFLYHRAISGTAPHQMSSSSNTIRMGDGRGVLGGGFDGFSSEDYCGRLAVMPGAQLEGGGMWLFNSCGAPVEFRIMERYRRVTERREV
jgi:hypothetical protein